MTLPTVSYLDQNARWPSSGRHILACFDEETIFVYQAYSSAIGLFAARNGYFGEGFSYGRMSWIKPNFLWMMYRSDWGRAHNQEVILGIKLRRQFFDSLLMQSVPSNFSPEKFVTQEEWKSAVAQSDVRIQWDPDHSPRGDKVDRRAVQLGLRGVTLESYGKREIIEIVDMSEFVASQRFNAIPERYNELEIPYERVYRPDERTAIAVGLAPEG